VSLLLASSGTKTTSEYKCKESTSLMLSVSIGNADASTQKVALWIAVNMGQLTTAVLNDIKVCKHIVFFLTYVCDPASVK
jgi:hypothetical protein